MLENIYNFLQLSDTIATSGQPTEEQLSDVADKGHEVVINLGLSGTEYALEDEEAIVHEPGMEYIHIPVLWEEPTLEDVEEFMSAVERHKDQKVYIHCAANMRVSVFVALYRILRLGWTRERALTEVHRIWQPNDRWLAFVDEVLGVEN